MPTGLVVGVGRVDKRVVRSICFSSLLMPQVSSGWDRTPAVDAPLPHDEIAQLAFHLFVSRGRQDGHDVEDWLRAEEELGRYA